MLYNNCQESVCLKSNRLKRNTIILIDINSNAPFHKYNFDS